MTNSDYHRTLDVNASPQKAYEAVTTGFENWWTSSCTPLARIGDIAIFKFPPKDSSWTFRPITLKPNTLVEHECVGANHLHDGLPVSIRTEWLGSVMQFDIEENKSGSRIIFTHRGLKPNLDCYEICEAGWDFFFMDSLKSYLNSGAGSPHH